MLQSSRRGANEDFDNMLENTSNAKNKFAVLINAPIDPNILLWTTSRKTAVLGLLLLHHNSNMTFFR